MKLLRFLFTANFILLIIITNLFAAQRMGIARGVYILLPRNVTTIPAYCMDYTRSAPTENTDYSQVLTDPSDAVVKFQDGSRLSLQEALSHGKVKIRGNKVSFSEMVKNLKIPAQWNRLSKEDQDELKPILEIWDSLSPDEIKEMDQLFSEITGGEGDHTKLAFENLTGQKLEIEFLKTSVLGESGETLGGLNLEFLDNNSEFNQEEIQLKIWMANNMQHQVILKKLGYYEGEITGIVDDDTKEAITRFQKDKRLNVGVDGYGIVDQQTEKMLLKYK